jgi:hypothetical protein
MPMGAPFPFGWARTKGFQRKGAKGNLKFAPRHARMPLFRRN